MTPSRDRSAASLLGGALALTVIALGASICMVPPQHQGRRAWAQEDGPAPLTKPATGVPPRFDRKERRPSGIDEKTRLLERELRKLTRQTGELPPQANPAPGSGATPPTPSGEKKPSPEPRADPVPVDRPLAEIPPLETEHYAFRSDLDQELLRDYAKQMEKFFERFCKVFTFDGRLQRKCDVWIYRDQKTFMKQENKPATVGGFYTLGNRRVTVYHGKFGMTGDTRVVLAHEGTHQFQHLVSNGIFQNAPTWIIEGLAVFFESSRYDGKKVHIGEIPRDRLIVVQRAIKAGEYVQIKDLIETRQSEFTGFHYAHAWSLIYWFVYTHKQNQAIFKRYWDLCRTQRVRTRDFEKAIGVPIEELETHWKEWVLDLDPTDPGKQQPGDG